MKIVLMPRMGWVRRWLSFFFRRAPGRASEIQTQAEQPPQVRVPEHIEVLLPPKPRVERTLIVGVDFGTSSTKVIWQDLTDNVFEVVRWKPTKDFASVLLPSTVTIRDRSVRFGLSGSDLQEGDTALYSVKLCILCRRKPSICRCNNRLARNGMVCLPRIGEGAPASSVACLFLAHVFREVERRLSDRFPDDDLVLIWNIGCPMDHLDVLESQLEWEKMAGVAMEIREKVSNPVELECMRALSGMIQRFQVPSEGDRNYFIRPEGLAAVKAFLASPRAEAKTYAIVDVGAGTTEVSFFFNGRDLNEPGQPPRAVYLADSTMAVGGGRIDAELAEAWGCNVDDARRQKEAGQSTTIASVRDISLQYDQTCREIMKHKRLTAAADKRFDLFTIGGGKRFKPLQTALQSWPLPGGFVREGWQQLQPPATLRDRRDLLPGYDFLAVACGLASSLDWEYYPPREVEAMPDTPLVRVKRDVDEYYPK